MTRDGRSSSVRDPHSAHCKWKHINMSLDETPTFTYLSKSRQVTKLSQFCPLHSQTFSSDSHSCIFRQQDEKAIKHYLTLPIMSNLASSWQTAHRSVLRHRFQPGSKNTNLRAVAIDPLQKNNIHLHVNKNNHHLIPKVWHLLAWWEDQPLELKKKLPGSALIFDMGTAFDSKQIPLVSTWSPHPSDRITSNAFAGNPLVLNNVVRRAGNPSSNICWIWNRQVREQRMHLSQVRRQQIRRLLTLNELSRLYFLCW